MTRTLFSLTSLFVASSLFTAGYVQAGLKDDVNNYLYKRKALQVVESYTDNTVLKTISNLTDHISELNFAALKLKVDPSETNLGNTIEAWKNVQAAFNASQIFMFGPAAHYDFHKQLAIWPMDKVLVDHALAEIEAGDLTIDAKTLREKTASMRGLNTVKYFLFENGQPKDVATITPFELNFLTAVTEVLLWEGLDFEASWIGTENLPVNEQAILAEAGIKKRKPYAEEFKNPGQPGSRYFSASVPLQELIQESSTVVEDMLPFIEDLAHINDSEPHYWQSIDPFADMINRLKGVENSYLGGISDSRGPSFSDLVAKKDPVLDERIKAAFASVVQRLEAARELKNGERDKYDLAVKVVHSECAKLFSRMMTATPLVTADPAVEPFASYGSDI